MEVSRSPSHSRPRRQARGATRGVSLHCAVPDEIMVRILYFVSPEENLSSFQLISRRHSRLANEPLLWKHHCRTSFKHWDSRHEFALKLALPATAVDWKRLWMMRRGQNARVLRLLDDILATKIGRVAKFEQICLLEYDAKDILLEQCSTPDSASDVLARRYYAGAALASIHRGVAIKEWAKFQSPHAGPPRLDRALAAFDMFTLREQDGDIDDTEALLDSLAREFLAAHPGFDGLSTRGKALLLLEWVRAENLTGMENPDTNYRNIQNCLLGHALRDENHPSLPLVSSAIYASLAERVGMRAACCSFPAHVHVGVFAPAGETLDGVRPRELRTEPDMMYLDPYGADHEIHIEELRMRLEEYSSGWHEPGRREAFLKASPTSVLIIRAAHNIQVSCVRLQQARDDPPNAGFHGPDTSPNMESMLYAVLWVSLLLTPTAQRLWDNNLEHFLNRFRRYFSEDAWLLRKYLAPLYDNFLMLHNLRDTPRSGWEDVHLALQMEQKVDERPLIVQRRNTWMTQHRVRYHVGQVFIHKRFHTHGIITGWNADSAKHNIQSVARGQPTDDEMWIPPVYYTCLRTDVDRIIVAEPNIALITNPDDVPAGLVRAAGKFFKRFNRATCTFESNVRESFPDD